MASSTHGRPQVASDTHGEATVRAATRSIGRPSSRALLMFRRKSLLRARTFSADKLPAFAAATSQWMAMSFMHPSTLRSAVLASDRGSARSSPKTSVNAALIPHPDAGVFPHRVPGKSVLLDGAALPQADAEELLEI